MPVFRTVEPTVEPVSLADVKLHIRHDASVGTTEDAMLTRWIKGARQRAEHLAQRAFCTQTWQQNLDAFPPAIELPWSPIQSVSFVKYYDENNALQTLAPADYKVDIQGRSTGYIVPAYGLAWPSTYPEINSVSSNGSPVTAPPTTCPNASSTGCCSSSRTAITTAARTTPQMRNYARTHNSTGSSTRF